MRRYLLFLFLLSCAPQKGPHKPLSASTKGQVTFEQVRAVFAEACASCHPSRSAPDWLNFEQAKSYVANGRLQLRVITDRSMPPPNTAEAVALSESKREMIAKWIQAGAPLRSSGPTAEEENLGAVQQCLQCHGVAGPGPEADPRIPRLSGQNKAYLVMQLQRYKWRERKDPTEKMNEIAVGMQTQEINEVAEFYSKQKGLIPIEIEKLSADHLKKVGRGARLSEQLCNSCHMSATQNRRPLNDLIPLLGGQSRIYLMNQLLYFRTLERKNPLMHEFAKELSNDDLEAVTHFYSLSPSSTM